MACEPYFAESVGQRRDAFGRTPMLLARDNAGRLVEGVGPPIGMLGPDDGQRAELHVGCR